MSSPCHTERAALVLLAAGLALAACDRQNRSYASRADAQGATPQAVTTLFPGGGQAPPEDPRGRIYDGNPYHIAQGKRYFSWYNCTGCHFNGGGGIGPALMDDQWTYGGRIDQIYHSIIEGRPNGMPSWRGKIPDAQVWEIAAYVRSLSAPTAANAGAEAPSNPPAPIAPHAPPAQASKPATAQ
jgi:cytochrome c oxidase cbb3-type subunit 3